MADTLPTTLPLLPLAEKVLLPSIVTKLVITGADAISLARHICINASQSFLVCVPLNPPTHSPPSSTTPLIARDPACLPSRTGRAEMADVSQLYHFGCAAQILEIDDSLPDTIVLLVQGICRSQIEDISSDGIYLEASLTHYPEPSESDEKHGETQLLAATFRTLCLDFVTQMRDIGVPAAVLSQFSRMIDCCPASNVANLLLCITESTFAEKLRVLEITDFKERLQEINVVVSRHLQVLQASKDIQQNIEQKLDKKRRDFYLRQQVNAITPKSPAQPAGTTSSEAHTEPFTQSGDDDDELAALVGSLNRAGLPDHAVSVIRRDVNRLRSLSSSSPESSLLRTYLECIADLPWQKKTPDRVDIAAAKRQLDADHYGLDQVKRRIVEYLAVVKVKKDLSPPILCFVGPPGVGKTTLGKSIATALRRQFHRISLGGIHDEAEIRGHRRTYVGALPGLLIHGMRKCGVNNPVILLDEIDKIAQTSHQGDPAAALLEVLDPAQNSTFTDHFVNLPFDLSNVLFIATANSLDAIPGPLLDRMEVVNLRGYTFDEKLSIARSHLVPKQVHAHGLTQSGLELPDSVLLHVAERYTQESGVRNLDRHIASICRYKCREYVDREESDQLDQFERVIHTDDISTILGMELFEREAADAEAVPGVVTGLAYSQSGNGGILLIEASQMPGHGALKLTGSLGDVIKESAQIAVSWVKANAYSLHLTQSSKHELFRDTDLHVHMPNGAVPKDGPSAGITLVTCIISLLSGRCVPMTTAMTGEITLRGQVRPVGGIKEKVISAHRAGITHVILPAMNRKDVVQDIPKKVRDSMTFTYCKTIWEVVEAAFHREEGAILGPEPGYASRL